MRNRWLQIGCFLTGYNYNILKGCSEFSARKLMRYTSAMLIICLLWAFIGYTFTSHYLKAAWYFAIVGSLTMIVIVIQIERQVILSSKSNRKPLYFRLVIGLTMAVIGSVIIDQLIFKEDIEKQRIKTLGEEVKRDFPVRAEDLKRQIKELDSTILHKENERVVLVNDIIKNPTIPIYTKHTISPSKQNNDSINREVVTRTSSQIQSPKIALIQPLDDQIAGLRFQKQKKDSLSLSLRSALEAELKQKVGFLDELNLMILILSESKPAMIAWFIWLIFLFGLEAFILVSKWSETDTDYDKRIEQQMTLHFKRIELLGKQ
jgi:Domain of unknown function (DUF4407)